MLEHDLKNTHISDSGGNFNKKQSSNISPQLDRSAPRSNNFVDELAEQSKNILNYKQGGNDIDIDHSDNIPNSSSYTTGKSSGPTFDDIKKQSSNLDSSDGNYANKHYTSLVDPVINDRKVEESESKIHGYAEQKKYDGAQSGVNTSRSTDIKSRHTGLDPGMDSSAAGNFKVVTDDNTYGGYNGYSSQDPNLSNKTRNTGYTEKYDDYVDDDKDTAFDNYAEDINQQQRRNSEKLASRDKHDSNLHEHDESGGILSTIGNYLGIGGDNAETHDTRDSSNLKDDNIAVYGDSKNSSKRAYNERGSVNAAANDTMPGGITGVDTQTYDTNTNTNAYSNDYATPSQVEKKVNRNTNTYPDNLNSHTGAFNETNDSSKLFKSDLEHPSGASKQENYKNANYHHQREGLTKDDTIRHQRRPSYEEEANDYKSAMAFSGGKSSGVGGISGSDNSAVHSKKADISQYGATGGSGAVQSKKSDSTQYGTTGGVLLAGSKGGMVNDNKVSEMNTESTPYRMVQNPKDEKYLTGKDATDLRVNKKELGGDSNKYLSNEADTYGNKKEQSYGQSFAGGDSTGYYEEGLSDRKTYDNIDKGLGDRKLHDNLDSGLGNRQGYETMDTSDINKRSSKLARDAGYEDYQNVIGGTKSETPQQVTNDGGYYAGTRSKEGTQASGVSNHATLHNNVGHSTTGQQSRMYVRDAQGKTSTGSRSAMKTQTDASGRVNENARVDREDYAGNPMYLDKHGQQKSVGSSGSGSGSTGLGGKIKKAFGVEKKKSDSFDKQHQQHQLNDPNDVFISERNEGSGIRQTGELNPNNYTQQQQQTYTTSGVGGTGTGAVDNDLRYKNTSSNVPRNVNDSTGNNHFHKNEGYSLREDQGHLRQQGGNVQGQGQGYDSNLNNEHHRKKGLIDTIKDAF